MRASGSAPLCFSRWAGVAVVFPLGGGNFQAEFAGGAHGVPAIQHEYTPALVCLSSEPRRDAVLAHVGEKGHEVGKTKQLANLFA